MTNPHLTHYQTSRYQQRTSYQNRQQRIDKVISRSGWAVLPARVKRNSRVLHNADDLLLLEHLEVAHRAAERHTHRTVSPQVTRTLQLRDFPLVACPLKFDFPPLISVEQISYFDQDDASQTIASSQYRVIPQTDGVGFVEFDDDYSTPTVSWRPDAVTISYTSGYGERGDIPETIKHGILMYVEYLYTGDESQREGAERIWDSECYGIYA